MTDFLLHDGLIVWIKLAEDRLTFQRLQLLLTLFVELFLLGDVTNCAICDKVVTDTALEERSVVVLWDFLSLLLQLFVEVLTQLLKG